VLRYVGTPDEGNQGQVKTLLFEYSLMERLTQFETEAI